MAEFVQIIRFTSDLDPEKIKEKNDEYREATKDSGTYTSALFGRDLDSGEYVLVVTFPSQEAAAANDALPETAASAEEMASMATDLSFSNIEVLERS